MIKKHAGLLYYDKDTQLYTLDTLTDGSFTGPSEEDVLRQAKAVILEYWKKQPQYRLQGKAISFDVDVPDAMANE